MDKESYETRCLEIRCAHHLHGSHCVLRRDKTLMPKTSKPGVLACSGYTAKKKRRRKRSTSSAKFLSPADVAKLVRF